ncbi:hypothetical protein [Rhizobium sp.]|uniref:hypothetical protein n=1 Tax=Rhizobium sp. TaxID=391 RepID=UPI002AA808C9
MNMKLQACSVLQLKKPRKITTMQPTTESDSQLSGRLMAYEILFAQLISERPDRDAFLTKAEQRISAMEITLIEMLP